MSQKTDGPELIPVQVKLPDKEVVKELIKIEDEVKHKQVTAIEQIGNQFGFYGVLSMVFGVFYTLCLYKNPNGIMIPLFVVIAYELALLILNKMKIAVKRESYVLIGISVIIGVSSCRTADVFFTFYNKVALLLLWSVFWMHQFYEDGTWNIGKYMGSIVLLWGQMLSTLGYPFKHFQTYIKSLKQKKYGMLIPILLGVLISIPLIIVLCILLSQADMVFQQILDRVIHSFFKPQQLFFIAVKWMVGVLGMYSLICGMVKRGIKEEQKDWRKEEPIIAITTMSIVGILYMVFCGIQIVYLFMGRGTLPEGITYSGYARQGFFQLLFVAVLNLVLVLSCLKYFKKSRVLNMVLTLISLCTYVMIASAACRMILYVQEYKLTMLRILVLWFLLLLSVLMAGVLVFIYRNDFWLFRYCLVVVSVGYLVLAWSKPDFIIADYNVHHGAEISQVELIYLSDLSADAAPVLRELQKQPEFKNNMNLIYYFNRINKDMSWRTYNFSYAKALSD